MRFDDKYIMVKVSAARERKARRLSRNPVFYWG